jgi:hypothetical protein
MNIGQANQAHQCQRVYCHTCDEEVNASMKDEELECDQCHGCFVEELSTPNSQADLLAFRDVQAASSQQENISSSSIQVNKFKDGMQVP